MNNSVALTGTTKLLSLKNNGVEKLYVNNDGQVVGAMGANFGGQTCHRRVLDKRTHLRFLRGCWRGRHLGHCEQARGHVHQGQPRAPSSP